MDSSGRMYMPPEYEAELVKMFKDKVEALTEEVSFGAVPEDALPIEDETIAKELAGMNRTARRAYFSERRRGAAEADALEAARQTLKP